MQILNQITKQDAPDKVFPLVDDTVLSRVVHAWDNTPVTWNPPHDIDPLPSTEKEQLDLLWQYTVFDVDQLSLNTGLSNAVLHTVIARARSLRLIYPNGSISALAKRMITLRVAEELARLRNAASTPQQGSKK